MCLFRYPSSKFTRQCLSARPFHLLLSRRSESGPGSMKTPDLIYFPQVLRWLKTKIGFKVLQKSWDPEFSEGAFIYGTTQAICRITEELSSGDRDGELKDLVTAPLYRKLQADIRGNLSELQRQIIALRPRDIKLLIPIEVRLHQEEERRIASVALRSLAVKWHTTVSPNPPASSGGQRLALVALQTEFVRDYSSDASQLPAQQWTVCLFDILECGMVGEVRGAPR